MYFNSEKGTTIIQLHGGLMEKKTVKSDAFFLITVKWKGGFKHKVACRGYNLKSWMDFEDSLEYVDSYNYVETTEEVYNKLVFGA